ncbi:MAG: undecaprenyl-diphosphate phosphatase [Candidatus Pelagibacter sp. TMED286]|nr:MAG: undecaprenyl-diphosphate phosphatase [Candidatus Pelagibacter sp. TMED286]
MIEILILSIVQGITEFLPVSSSSHLIFISEYFNFENQSLSIDVSCHIGSFIAVMVYFQKDIFDFFKNKALFIKIFISSLPVMIVGFFLAETGLINNIRNLETITWATIIFGIFLYISDKFKQIKNIKKDFTIKSAFLIGILQVFSLIPGVSRSGIAITAGRLLNFKRVDSAKISFLLSIPILFAVSIFGIKNIIISNDVLFTKINILSIFFSFLFSFMTIKYFLLYIKEFSMNIFVYYRILLGALLFYITYL